MLEESIHTKKRSYRKVLLECCFDGNWATRYVKKDVVDVCGCEPANTLYRLANAGPDVEPNKTTYVAMKNTT